jgi:hypothetical protein
VAPQVANSGVIEARMGHVILAGAETHTLDLYGDGLLSISVTGQVRTAPVGPDGKPVAALVTNTGTIAAEGGTVLLTAQAADGIVQTLVAAGGKLRADTVGDKTGTIRIAGIGGSITIEGDVAARGAVAGTKGGDVEVNATGAVRVAAGARVSASGDTGGGTGALGTTLARAKGGSGVTPTLTAQTVTVEAGAKGAGMVSRVSSASPTAIFESRTMSQWSFRNVPEECREVVCAAYATDVTPITLMPRARARWAISTGRALRPDREMITRASPVRSGEVSRTALARPSTRSRAEPRVAGVTSTPTTPGTASRFIRARPPAR